MTTSNKADPLTAPVSGMYAERVEATKRGQWHGLFGKRNPDARRIYFMGVRDLMTTINTMRKDKVPPDIMAKVLQSIDTETKNDSPGN